MSNLTNMPRAKTKEMEYGMKYLAVDSTMRRAVFPPTTGSGTYAGTTSTVIEFELPTGRPGEFVDFQQSFFKFGLVNTNTATAGDATTRSMACDNTSHCVINRFMVYYGSTLVEDITNYNVLARLLNDIHNDETSLKYRKSLTELSEDELITANRKGHGKLLTQNVVNQTCIQFISGAAGILMDKMLPVWAMSFPIRIVIHLESPVVAFQWGQDVNATQCAYEVRNPQLYMTYIQTDAQTARSTLPSDNIIRIPIEGYRSYIHTVNQNQTNMSIPISARFASIRTLYTIMRVQTNFVNPHVNTIGLRTKNYLENYQLRSGADVIPNSTIDCTQPPEVAMELLRTIHGMNVTQFPMKFKNTSFCNDSGFNPTILTVAPEEGTFVIPLEMESLVRNSDKLMSGTDARAADLFLDLKFGSQYCTTSMDGDNVLYEIGNAAQTGANNNARMDTFIHHDKYILIDPSTGIVNVEI